MKSRLPLPNIDELDASQRAIHDSIVATRGNLDGPFLAWMHSPELASRAEKVGAFCRYGTGLSLLESELLILLVASRFRCEGERQIHQPIAIKAGLSEADAEAIWRGERVELGARLAWLQHLTVELLTTHRIANDSYAAVIAEFGVKGLVEVIGVVGYYAMVAVTLNAFEMTKE